MARLDQDVPDLDGSHRLRGRRRRARRPERSGGALPPRGRRVGRGDAGGRPSRRQGRVSTSNPREAGAPAARARTGRRLAHRATGRARAVAPRPAVRCQRRHALGRMAAAGAARAGAGRRARRAAARRADQSPRSRRDHLAGDVSRGLSGRARLRHPRSRVPPAGRDADRRNRSRAADLVAWRLRDVPAQEDTSGWPTKRSRRTNSTSAWRKRKRGCVRASRRGGRATKGAFAR